MKVYYWHTRSGLFHAMLLWDGKNNTYWTDEMKPSGGYKKMRSKFHPLTDARFIYIGEL